MLLYVYATNINILEAMSPQMIKGSLTCLKIWHMAVSCSSDSRYSLILLPNANGGLSQNITYTSLYAILLLTISDITTGRIRHPVV